MDVLTILIFIPVATYKQHSIQVSINTEIVIIEILWKPLGTLSLLYK